MPKNSIIDKKFKVVYLIGNKKRSMTVMADDQKSAINKIHNLGYTIVSIEDSQQSTKLKRFKKFNKNVT